MPDHAGTNSEQIVNIASIAGKDGNRMRPLSRLKAGIIGLTKSLGKELADTGVRVNCVTPAAVKTPLFSQMTQQQIDWMLSKDPDHAIRQLDSGLAGSLAGERQCSFSTGGVFDISGGQTTY